MKVEVPFLRTRCFFFKYFALVLYALLLSFATDVSYCGIDQRYHSDQCRQNDLGV